MPLTLGKVTVNVSLCGSIPRRHLAAIVPEAQREGDEDDRGARTTRSRLSELTSSDLNSLPWDTMQGRLLAEARTSAYVEATEDSTESRCKISLSDCPSQKPETHTATAQLLLPLERSQTVEDNMPSVARTKPRPMMRLAPSPPLIDPPQWAVPARGEARLEPVCEAYGTHEAVELTTRASFRVGRSPNSDIQLWHETSSRRHALLFHHPNGSCYIVDCGSAHGTFVNGKRVHSTPESGMVVPHRVRRGALIRFGGPGAPAFVLKSFSAGMSTRLISETPVLSPKQEDSKSLLQFNTRLNALGGKVLMKPVAPIVRGGGILKKRSFEDLAQEPPHKRQRCSSPPLAPPEQLRLVSPDNISARGVAPLIPSLSSKRVTFNDVPEAFYPALVTPDVLSSEDEASVDSNN